MKKFLIILLASSLAFACSNRDREGVPVASEIETAFEAEFPGVGNARWSKAGAYYVADFSHQGLTRKAWFNTNGNWQMTETLISTGDLDSEVSHVLHSSKYSGLGQIRRAIYITRPTLEEEYIIETSHNGKGNCEIYLSSDGTVIKTIYEASAIYPDHRLEIAHPVARSAYTYIGIYYPNSKIVGATLYYPGISILTIVEQDTAKTLTFDVMGRWERTSWTVDESDVESNHPAVAQAFRRCPYFQTHTVDEIIFVATNDSLKEVYYVYTISAIEEEISLDISVDGTISRTA